MDTAVLPRPEGCNALDDDLDGLIDEGKLNACGQCGVLPDEACECEIKIEL